MYAKFKRNVRDGLFGRVDEIQGFFAYGSE